MYFLIDEIFLLMNVITMFVVFPHQRFNELKNKISRNLSNSYVHFIQ